MIYAVFLKNSNVSKYTMDAQSAEACMADEFAVLVPDELKHFTQFGVDANLNLVGIDSAIFELKKTKLKLLGSKIENAKEIKIKYLDFFVQDSIEKCQEIMVRKFANGDVFDYDIDGSGYSLIGIPREIAHNMQSECERIRTDLRVFEKYYAKKIEDALSIDELNSITFSPINIRGKQFGIDTKFILEIEQNENISVVTTYGDANA